MRKPKYMFIFLIETTPCTVERNRYLICPNYLDVNVT